MATHYIGLDVDGKMVEVAVEHRGRVVRRERVATTIPALREVLASVPGRKEVTVEEGPLAGWLYRQLHQDVDRLVVCDPRRNKLIDHDGDKSDRIDAAKLAALLRGGYLREVHHSTDLRRVALREAVALYHDRVREAVRQGHKLRARCRQHGLRPPGRVLREQASWQEWLAEAPSREVRTGLEILWLGFETAVRQVQLARREQARLSRSAGIVKLWQEWPGVGPVRAVTLLAYLETPWRFRSVKALWKYCGVGLVRTQSGTDRHGHPREGTLKLVWQCNRRLKDVVMGAAVSAIRQGGNRWSEEYERQLRAGRKADLARHAVARKMLSGLWGQWKSFERDARGRADGRPA
jgi:transposase